MPKKEDIIKRLDEAKDFLEDDLVYNYGLIKNDKKLVKLVIEHPNYNIKTETK